MHIQTRKGRGLTMGEAIQAVQPGWQCCLVSRVTPANPHPTKKCTGFLCTPVSSVFIEGNVSHTCDAVRGRVGGVTLLLREIRHKIQTPS